MIEIEISLKNADAISMTKEQVTQFQKLLNVVLRKSRDDHNDTTLAPYWVAAPPVKYPIQWKSLKQRRAFFATNGFGRGIPAVSTGKMLTAWKLKLTRSNEEYQFSAVNNSGYEQFVTGMYQQPFHAITGWYQSDNVADRQGVQLANALSVDITQAWLAQK